MKALFGSVVVVLVGVAVAHLGRSGTGDKPRQLLQAFTSRTELGTAVDSWCGSSAGVESTRETYGTIDAWDVSQINDMSNLFSGKSTCNPPIGGWNVGSVTSFSSMFNGASSFNQNIGNWNTAAATAFNNMFNGASSFNQDIGNWNMAAATRLTGIFQGASMFNQPIGKWNTASVTMMTSAFNGATAFNQDIGAWETSQVTGMNNLFLNAVEFNQPLPWSTAKLTTIDGAFSGATKFNQPLGWDTSRVTSMTGTFLNAVAFNQELCWATCLGTEGTGAVCRPFPECTMPPQPVSHPSLGMIGAIGCGMSSFSSFFSSLSEPVTYTERAASDETCQICGGGYDLIAMDLSDLSWMLKAVVDASESVDCSSSRAFAINFATNKVYSSPLKNDGSMSCVADWTGVFPDQAAYAQGSFTVLFAFADLLGTPGRSLSLSPSYSSRLGDPTTNAMLTEPLLVVSSITAQAVPESSAYETTVQLSLGAQTAGCTFPSSVDIVLGTESGAGCRAVGVAMTNTPGQYKWKHTYSPADITGCGADVLSDAQFFKLAISVEIAYGSNWQQGFPSDRAWCFGEKAVTGPRAAQCFGDAAVVRPIIAGRQSATILISKSLVSESSSSVSRVVLSLTAYSATPCTGDIFSPQGTPRMTVKATGASESAVNSISWSAQDQNRLPATLSGTSNCGDQDPLTECATFVQSSCQVMNNFPDSTCSFANDDKVLIVTATTNQGSTTTVLDPKTASPVLPNKWRTCSSPRTQLDVTAQYQVSFRATREDDVVAGTKGVSLYMPIVGTLVLSNANAAGPLSIYISDVTVLLRLPSSTTPLASRTFTRVEKQRLMQSLSSPYYADAHYCRNAPSAGACTSFYSAYSNSLTASEAMASTYNVQGTHKSCQAAMSLTTMNQDRFIFTPRYA
jgi:hypothetical protein